MSFEVGCMDSCKYYSPKDPAKPFRDAYCMFNPKKGREPPEPRELLSPDWDKWGCLHPEAHSENVRITTEPMTPEEIKEIRDLNRRGII